MPDKALVSYQGFMFFNSAVALAVAAVVGQRQSAVDALRRARDELESRVVQRTADLQAEVSRREKRETELHKLNRTLNALRHSDEAILRRGTEMEYLRDVCRMVTDDCGHAMVWIGYAEHGEQRIVRPMAHAGFEEGYLETLGVTWADTELGRGPTGTAIRTGKPSGCSNMLTDPKFAPWRAEAVKRGYASSIVLPLLANGKAFGAITIYSRQPDPFTADEVNLLSELADNVAHGIGSIRLRVAHARAELALRQSEQQYRHLNQELERRVAERSAELRSASRYARSLLEAGLDPLITISTDGKITDVNKATELVTGASREELVGTNFSDYFTKPKTAGAGYQKVLAEGLVRNYPLTIRHVSGRLTEVLYNATVYRDEDGKVKGVFAAARDVTESRAAEQERKKLLRRLAEAQESERGRISRELHDQLGQELTALKLGLRLVKNRVPPRHAVRQSVTQLEQLTDNLMQEIHRLAWELHPASLDDLGLEAALRRYTAEWAERNSISMDFDSNGMEIGRLARELETALYRITQEALTNISKHAKAKKVSVLLTCRSGQMSLIVEDDGAGFDAETVFQGSGAKPGRLGLLGMRERVRLAGGTIDVESAAGTGTTVIVRIPLGSEFTSERIEEP